MLLSQKVINRLGEGKSDSSVWNMIFFLLHNIVIIYSKANERRGQGTFKGTGNYHSQLKFTLHLLLIPTLMEGLVTFYDPQTILEFHREKERKCRVTTDSKVKENENKRRKDGSMLLMWCHQSVQKRPKYL